jgi:hypothetical protein
LQHTLSHTHIHTLHDTLIHAHPRTVLCGWLRAPRRHRPARVPRRGRHRGIPPWLAPLSLWHRPLLARHQGEGWVCGGWVGCGVWVVAAELAAAQPALDTTNRAVSAAASSSTPRAADAHRPRLRGSPVWLGSSSSADSTLPTHAPPPLHPKFHVQHSLSCPSSTP